MVPRDQMHGDNKFLGWKVRRLSLKGLRKAVKSLNSHRGEQNNDSPGLKLRGARLYLQ